tara:strand:+ start:998 stop:1336 length:339 start_codon:yes stop_codon:yes gene_type:complete
MVNNLIIKKKLESLLQTKWGDFMDKSQLMRRTMEFARDTEYRVFQQQDVPPQKLELSITHFALMENGFEVWIEFTIPKGQGVIVGTHVCSLSLSGKLDLTDSHGTHFLPKSS